MKKAMIFGLLLVAVAGLLLSNSATPQNNADLKPPDPWGITYINIK